MNQTMTLLDHAGGKFEPAEAAAKDIKVTEGRLDRLQRRIEATKAIRFQATIRLIRRHKLSAYVTAMMSLYVIGLSLIPNVFALSQKQAQVLLACTIVMSTFIVILTLTEGYESFLHKAEVLHDSARQLNRLAFNMSQKDIRSEGSGDWMLEVAKEYESIIDKSVVNHAECDYIRVRARRPELFGFEVPKFPKTLLGKFGWQFKRTIDWLQSVIREFLWLSLPVIFSILSSFMIYLMIAYNWPENMAANFSS
jgi:hypothetical protein